MIEFPKILVIELAELPKREREAGLGNIRHFGRLQERVDYAQVCILVDDTAFEVVKFNNGVSGEMLPIEQLGQWLARYARPVKPGNPMALWAYLNRKG